NGFAGSFEESVDLPFQSRTTGSGFFARRAAPGRRSSTFAARLARPASSASAAAARGAGPADLKAERASMFTPAFRVETLTLYVFFGSTPVRRTPIRYVAVVAPRRSVSAAPMSFVRMRERPPVPDRR